jgi:hypothetical protein
MRYGSRRVPNRPWLIYELRETKRRLQESRSRLEELVMRREEELRFWEEELARLREEEAERRRAEDKQLFEELLSRVQEEIMSPGPSIAKAWQQYEERWKNLHAIPSGLTFQTIPWPVAVDVTVPDGLDSHLISQFILSPEHSYTMPRERRIYTALLRWHTDHFDRKVLHKVIVKDRHSVKECVGIVVRCLNSLLALERE